MKADDPRHGQRTGYNNHGCRCQPCTAANTRAHKLYLLGRAPRLINPTGTRRRIQALLVLGWTYEEVGSQCGRTSRNWARNLVATTGRVREDVARDVAAAYEAMSMTHPVGRYRARGRSIAVSKGWVPPMAWESGDIDDPSERPDPGYRPVHQRQRHELLAEWDHLRSLGVSIHQAARQLGVTVEAIEVAVRRQGVAS